MCNLVCAFCDGAYPIKWRFGERVTLFGESRHDASRSKNESNRKVSISIIAHRQTDPHMQRVFGDTWTSAIIHNTPLCFVFLFPLCGTERPQKEKESTGNLASVTDDLRRRFPQSLGACWCSHTRSSIYPHYSTLSIIGIRWRWWPDPKMPYFIFINRSTYQVVKVTLLQGALLLTAVRLFFSPLLLSVYHHHNHHLTCHTRRAHNHKSSFLYVCAPFFHSRSGWRQFSTLPLTQPLRLSIQN